MEERDEGVSKVEERRHGSPSRAGLKEKRSGSRDGNSVPALGTVQSQAWRPRICQTYMGLQHSQPGPTLRNKRGDRAGPPESSGKVVVGHPGEEEEGLESVSGKFTEAGTCLRGLTWRAASSSAQEAQSCFGCHLWRCLGEGLICAVLSYPCPPAPPQQWGPFLLWPVALWLPPGLDQTLG